MSVIKGFVVNKHFLIIIKTKWPQCSVSPQTMMKNFTDVFSTPKVKKERKLVIQSGPTLCDPMECSPPGSSVHGILQARIWSRLPFPSPRDLPEPRDQIWVSWISGRFFTTEPPGKAPQTHQGLCEGSLGQLVEQGCGDTLWWE